MYIITICVTFKVCFFWKRKLCKTNKIANLFKLTSDNLKPWGC